MVISSKKIFVVLTGIFYLCLALFADYHVLGHFNSYSQCSCGDPGLFTWFLALGEYNTIHLHNLFYTNFIWAPLGANLMNSTSVIFLAVVFSPITALFGPVASFNLAIILGIFLNAFSFFFVAKEITHNYQASFVAGCVFEINPFSIQALAYGQLNLGFDLFIPLSALLLYKLLSDPTKTWPAIVLGLTLGVEILISTELLSLWFVVAFICLVLYLLLWQKQAILVLRSSIKKLLIGAVFAILIWIIPLYWALFGPNHLNEPPRPSPWFYGIGLLDFLLGNFVSSTRFHLASGYSGTFSIAFVYLGVILVSVLFLGIILSLINKVRLKQVFFILLVTVVIYWFEIGSVFRLKGNAKLSQLHNFWFLPWKIINLIPLLKYASPQRLSPFYWFFVGLLIAYAIKEITITSEKFLKKSSSFIFRNNIVVAVAAILCLIQLLLSSNLPYRITRVTVPNWFIDSESFITKNANVLVIPSPFGITGTKDMVYQALTNFPFKLVGAQSIFIPKKELNELAPPNALLALKELSSGKLLNQQQQNLAKLALMSMKINYVVMPAAKLNGFSAILIDAILKKPPIKVGSAWIWTVTAEG